MSLRVLVVEDEVPFRELVAKQLSRRGHAVTAVGSAEDALAHQDEFDVALCDISLPGLSGIELIRRLRARGGIECIVLTGQGSIPAAIEAMELGADHYLEEPVEHGTQRGTYGNETKMYVNGQPIKGAQYHVNDGVNSPPPLDHEGADTATAADILRQHEKLQQVMSGAAGEHEARLAREMFEDGMGIAHNPALGPVLSLSDWHSLCERLPYNLGVVVDILANSTPYAPLRKVDLERARLHLDREIARIGGFDE